MALGIVIIYYILFFRKFQILFEFYIFQIHFYDEFLALDYETTENIFFFNY